MTARRTSALCPVCGFGFRGSYSFHLNNPVDVRRDDAGVIRDKITRCDWNLNTARIRRQYAAMLATGWVRAGTVAGRVVAPLGPGYPHLARMATTGQECNVTRVFTFGPENDPKVWWCPRWVRCVADVGAWTMAVRRQVIHELDGDADRCAVVEAASRVGGPHAVAELGAEVIAPRCSKRWVIDKQFPRVPGDACKFASGHAGACYGQRNTWSTSDGALPVDAEP